LTHKFQVCFCISKSN